MFEKLISNTMDDPEFSQILTNPILDIAARFWEPERYDAFRICYRSMRRLDDLVDDLKVHDGFVSEPDAVRLRLQIGAWLESIKARSGIGPNRLKLLKTMDRFGIPVWPWEQLCLSMLYDVEHSGFKDFSAFLRYTKGAAVAPASVFMHLCGVSSVDSQYSPPGFSIRKEARDLAIFSYLVHIIRDFRKDRLSNLNYFADNLLAEQSLTSADLHQIAAGAGITPSFRALIEKHLGFTKYYRARARHRIDALVGRMEPRYLFSLEVVFGLYDQIFERIDPAGGEFTDRELLPSPEEIHARLERIVQSTEKIW